MPTNNPCEFYNRVLGSLEVCSFPSKVAMKGKLCCIFHLREIMSSDFRKDCLFCENGAFAPEGGCHTCGRGRS